MNLALEQLTLFPPDTHANLKVMPGSEEARKMTAGYGQKLSEYLKRSDPVGLLAKMLMGTSAWGSTLYLLTWGGADYTAQAFVIPAAAIGASHKRDRVFIVAYSEFASGIERSEFDEERRWSGKTEQTRVGSINLPLAFPASAGLSERRSTGITESEEETRAGMEPEPERRSALANPASERCGETREHSGRSEERTAGSCSETLADSEGIASRRLPIREGETNSRLECSGKDVADTQRRSRKESWWTGKPVDSETDGDWQTGGLINDGNGPAQSRMGGSLDEFSAWLDGGINPLDALTEFIATYPQPALLGQPQYAWEPPRVATGVKDRAARLKALGNAVNPLQIFPIMYAIKKIDDAMREAITCKAQ